MIGREQIRAFAATPKGKLVIAGALMVTSWIFLVGYFFSDSISAFGDSESLSRARTQLKRTRAAHEQIAENYAELQEQKKRYRAVAAAAWRESRDGQVETALRQKITEAVAKLEFKLSSLGSVNTGRINNELYYADIDVSAEGKLDEIANLIAALEDIRPAPIWKRLNLRPDNRPRPQTVAGADSLNLALQNLNIEYTRVAMNGTLRMICADDNSVPGKERSVKP